MDEHTTNILAQYDKKITKLNISNKNIQGILDLRRFYYLEHVDCSNNKITQLVNLNQGLSKLTHLDCSNNLISDLTDIPYTMKSMWYKSNPIVKLKFVGNFIPKKYPKKLQYLEYGKNYNKSVDNLQASQTLSASLPLRGLAKPCTKCKQACTCCHPEETHLVLSQAMRRRCPKGITTLVFGEKFNQPVDNLPNSLKSLTLGYDFNLPVDNLPNGLTNLTFGYKFDLPVDNLPNSLIYLELGRYFKQPVNNLPNTIKVLKLGYWFKDIPINNLPNSIDELVLSDCFNLSIDNLSDNITKLTIGTYYDKPINKFPINIEELKFNGLEKGGGRSRFKFNLDLKPYYKLKKLYLPDSYDIKLGELPESVRYINFGSFYTHNIDDLPDWIEHIEFSSYPEDTQCGPEFFPKICDTQINKLPANLQTITVNSPCYKIVLNSNCKYGLTKTFNILNKIGSYKNLLEHKDEKISWYKGEPTKEKLVDKLIEEKNDLEKQIKELAEEYEIDLDDSDD